MNMWSAETDSVDEQTTKTRLSNDSSGLSFREVIELWCGNSDFRTYFITLIRDSSFDAYFWETPPVTNRSIDRPFEFVLVRAESLSRLRPDASPFASQFSSRPAEAVLKFPNLGGDAILIVPAPLGDDSCYTHLANFVRGAPESQVDEFWRIAGIALQQRISSQPTWLSTAGMGVSWLHLRLDSRPKYYRFKPYTVAG